MATQFDVRSSARRIAVWTVVALIIAQVIRPARTNPPTDDARTIRASGMATPEVLSIVERSCEDCHTHDTKWPWYSNVAPVSWVVVNHVTSGRRHLNFSDWKAYDPQTLARKLSAICENVKNGEMPMTSYVLAHETAGLSEDDKQVLCAWTERARGTIGQ